MRQSHLNLSESSTRSRAIHTFGVGYSSELALLLCSPSACTGWSSLIQSHPGKSETERKTA